MCSKCINKIVTSQNNKIESNQTTIANNTPSNNDPNTTIMSVEITMKENKQKMT